MKIAMIGMGRMGANMTRRLLKGGHTCYAYNRDVARVDAIAKEGAKPLRTLQEIVSLLERPRTVWTMLPAGGPTEEMVRKLGELLSEGDRIIDGGNTYFKDDVRRGKELAKKGIRYLDVGVSGGVWGLERGYCLMIGGDEKTGSELDPIFKTLAPGRGAVPISPGRDPKSAQERIANEGYVYCGPVGAGHFVKMVHNGIEYGMMQALAEGFNILKGASKPVVHEDYRFALDLAEISEAWRRGSVVSSWLLDLVAISLNKDPELSAFQGRVDDSGEGRWTVQAAIEESVPADILATSLFARFRSREERSFADQLLSAMRNEFGGHAEAKPEGRLAG